MMVSSSTSAPVIPGSEVELRAAKAQKFVEDVTPYSLNIHGLDPEDVTALWQSNRKLAIRVIDRVHAIFSGYRTNVYPIVDKLDPSTPSWNQYCDVIRLGANFKAAARVPKAQELLVYASVKKIILPIDAEIGQKYLLRAAQHQCPYAQYLLGTLANKPQFSEEDRAKMKKGLVCSAKLSKLPQALLLLGKLKLGKTPETGLKMIREAADKGLAEAEHELGLMYFHGSVVEKNDEAAAALLLKARRQGYIPAYNNLGVFFLLGIGGLTQDLCRATTLFKISADAGFRSGNYNLGYCHAMGWGVPESIQVAWDYYDISLTLRQLPIDLSLSNFTNVTHPQFPELSGG